MPLSSLAHHTCCCHLFRYFANISPTAFSAGRAPSAGGKIFFFFFLISGCCWTVTQLNSDIWEISCHLSLRQGTHLIAAETFNHPILRSVVFTALRMFSFSGFLRTAASKKKKKKSVNCYYCYYSSKLVFKDFLIFQIRI